MKKRVLFSFLLFLIIFFLIINNCGIEDSMMYFQEPLNLHYESDGILYFYGANQEEDDGEKLLVGYDIYYYFNDSKDAKLAMVRNPNVNTTAANPHNSELQTFLLGSRFPATDFTTSYLEEIYKYITLPVTENIVNDVLRKGNNDNVRFSFDNSSLISNAEINPKQSSSSYVFLEELFPNYSEYNGKTWGTGDIANFKGFLDKDYCQYKGLGTGSNIEYDMYVYAVAKGFNSKADKNKNYIESIKSNVIKITLKTID